MNKALSPFKFICTLGFITILLFSCNISSIKERKETDESQILRIAIDDIFKRNGCDTNKCLIFFRDSLINDFKKFDPMWYRHASQKENFTKEVKDTSFLSLFVRLIDSTLSKPFDTSIIKSGYPYKTHKGYKGPPSWRVYPRIYIAYTFSPVAFNDEHTLACMYESSNMYMDSSSEFLFFRKRNGEWVLDGRGFTSGS